MKLRIGNETIHTFKEYVYHFPLTNKAKNVIIIFKK